LTTQKGALLRSFGIARLRDIILLNLARFLTAEGAEVWEAAVGQLTSLALHEGVVQNYRSQSCEAISDITNNAIAIAKDLSDNVDLQMRLITPLKHLITTTASSVPGHMDMRIRALEILFNVLQTSGQLFTHGWPAILAMIKSSCDDGSGTGYEESDNVSPIGKSKSKPPAALVRIGFSSLQLVCSDFLSCLAPETIGQCIDCLGCFGSQNSDINISLTAVGLLWNVSDYIQTRRNEAKATKKVGRLKAMDELWMSLLLEFVGLCIDYRHEVRNGANQTLFRTITMNGQLIELWTWNDCIWKVLFLLLDSVKLVGVSSDPTMELEPDSKQVTLGRQTNRNHWDETKSLIITGVVSIFCEYFSVFRKLENFEQSWSSLLNYMREWVLLSQSHDVALSVFKCFQSLVNIAEKFKVDSDKVATLWQLLWKSWKSIGNEMLDQANGKYSFMCEQFTQCITFDHSQNTLTHYVNLSPPLIKLLGKQIDLTEFKEMLTILQGIIVYHLQGRGFGKNDTLSENWYTEHTTPLQKAILECFRNVQLGTEYSGTILIECTKYSLLCYRKWITDLAAYSIDDFFIKADVKGSIPNISLDSFDYMFVSFCREMLSFVHQKYKDVYEEPALYASGVYEYILKV
jgi:hypothetical protein